MKKPSFVLLGLLSILISGCVTLRLETKIDADGSGTKSLVLAFDKSVMSMMESMAEESGTPVGDIWETARAGAGSIKGATVKDYKDDEMEGIEIVVPFDNLDELEALSSSDAFEGADVVSVKRDGDTTTLNATVTVGDVESNLGEAGGESLEGFDLGEINLEYSYSVEVEGDILDYAPTEFATIENNKVTWDLTRASADTVDLMIRWKPGGGLDVTFLLLIVIAIGGVALVAIGILLSLRSRRDKPAPAAEE
jgi:hypothetical protein